MVEHNDEFGSSVPSPEGEAGADHMNYGESHPGGTAEESASPFEVDPTEHPEGHEALFKHPHPAPTPPDDAPRHPVFPMILGVAMLVTLVIAWVVNSKPGESSAAPTTTAEPAAAAGEPVATTPGTTPATPETAATAPAGDMSLKAEVDGLKNDLKAIQDRLESMAKPAPAPDLGPLNSKLAALSKSTDALADVPKKVDDLGHRIGSFEKSLTDLRGDVDALRSDVKKGPEPTTTTSGESPKPAEDVNVADSAMDQAVGLFKAGKYKEASDAFKKLTETHPNDARVWYYAALSRGSATKDWSGETTRLVEKGVEREKAGTPDSSKTDAVFADLNPAFKPWLDAYRKMAKAR